METNVRKHIRKRKNGASVVKKHKRRYSTHRVVDGKRQVFVDGFWKHDDYPFAPKETWSVERLLKEKKKLSDDLYRNLQPDGFLPHRKFGILTRRIKKIDRILKKKMKYGQNR